LGKNVLGKRSVLYVAMAEQKAKATYDGCFEKQLLVSWDSAPGSIYDKANGRLGSEESNPTISSQKWKDLIEVE
jgi:hypothetical protein